MCTKKDLVMTEQKKMAKRINGILALREHIQVETMSKHSVTKN